MSLEPSDWMIPTAMLSGISPEVVVETVFDLCGETPLFSLCEKTLNTLNGLTYQRVAS